MIYAVTGVGPRTGTSWVMEQLHAAGLPVYWSKSLNIDGAKYETYPNELSRLNNQIVKVWPNYLKQAKIGRMVLLRREFATQEASITLQMEREKKQQFVFMQTPKQMIEKSRWIIDQCKIERLEVRTEDLNNRIDDIVQWMSIPFEQERIA
jgi:hypothetical protein